MTTNNSSNISESGIIAYDGSGNFHGRTLAGGSSKITVTNGDGISGNPTIDAVESAFTLDNIGGTLSVSKGGTSDTSLTAYAVICGGTTSTGALQSIASVGTSGQILTSNGAGALPTFQTVSTGAYVFINTASASSSSTIDFTGLTSSYQAYCVIAYNVAPVTDATEFRFRTSADGTNWDTAASDYSYVKLKGAQNTTVSFGSLGDNANDYILLQDACGNASNEVADFVFWIINPSASEYTKMMYYGNYFNSSTVGQWTQTYGTRLSAAAVQGIRFYYSSGAVSTGEFKLYGVKTS